MDLIIKNVDIDLLNEQRLSLLDAVNKEKDEQTVDHLDGILNMLDEACDEHHRSLEGGWNVLNEYGGVISIYEGDIDKITCRTAHHFEKSTIHLTDEAAGRLHQRQINTAMPLVLASMSQVIPIQTSHPIGTVRIALATTQYREN